MTPAFPLRHQPRYTLQQWCSLIVLLAEFRLGRSGHIWAQGIREGERGPRPRGNSAPLGLQRLVILPASLPGRVPGTGDLLLCEGRGTTVRMAAQLAALAQVIAGPGLVMSCEPVLLIVISYLLLLFLIHYC